MNHRSYLRTAGFLALIGAAAAIGGPMDPPAGPVGSTYKTLAEVEPRIAINAANTPGDADSVFKITQPGSYYLTGNITANGKHGIEIAAGNLTIDLNGHTIAGNGQGGFSGIAQTAPALRSVRIRNGTVTAFGGAGIDLHELTVANRVRGGAIEGVIAYNNLGHGVAVGDGFTIRDCITDGNSGAGFVAGDDFNIAASAARANVGAGFNLGGAGTIRGCTASGNNIGFTVQANATFQDCTAESNGGNGFVTGSGSSLTNCTAAGNGNDGFHVIAGVVRGCTSQSNSKAGFRLQGGSLLADSTARNNSGAGILLTLGSNRIEGNLVVANAFMMDFGNTTGNAVFRNMFFNNGSYYQNVNMNLNSIGETRVTTGMVGLNSSSTLMNIAY